jgi:hypothetical protein
MALRTILISFLADKQAKLTEAGSAVIVGFGHDFGHDSVMIHGYR